MARAGRGDDGYFPRGRSVLRRVHGERIVGVLYGQRALLLQACHPLAFAGLNANSRAHDAPFRRLVHTAKIMEVVYFGTRADADEQTARVRKRHALVKGTLDEPAGPYARGTAYRADSPELLLWILATLADSAETIYERFVRRLSAAERRDYWDDYLTVGELFGLARDDAPPTYGAYRAYMDERLRSDDLHVLDEARDLGRKVAFELPMPRHRQPALLAVNHMVAGLLPARVRRLYGISWSPAHSLALDAMARSMRAMRPLTPHDVRRGSSARDYDVVARAERARLAA